MSMTTIKVTKGTRDRLKSQAASRHQTLEQYLGSLADRVETEERFDHLEQAIRKTPPELMKSWRRETAEWDRLAAAGSENLDDQWS